MRGFVEGDLAGNADSFPGLPRFEETKRLAILHEMVRPRGGGCNFASIEHGDLIGVAIIIDHEGAAADA